MQPALQQAQQQRDAFQDENRTLRAEMAAERKQTEGRMKEMEALLRQSHDALRQSQDALRQPNEASRQSQEALKQSQETVKQLQDSLRNSHELLRQSQDSLASVTQERNDLRTQVTTLQKEIEDVTLREGKRTTLLTEQLKLSQEELQSVRKIMESRVQSEESISKAERDSLRLQLSQKEQELRTVQQQAETSIKMLNQRQAALADLESRGSMGSADRDRDSEDLARLHETLHEWLTRDGRTISKNGVDTQRLAATIAKIRRKFDDVAILSERLAIEHADKQNLEQQLAELRQVQHRTPATPMTMSSSPSRSDRVYQDLEYYKKKSAEWEASAVYWQQLMKKTNALVGANGLGLGLNINISQTPPQSTDLMAGSQESVLKGEIARLQNELSLSQSDARRARQELESSKEDMQREFASLWLAVQQLNKMDASKETTIRELINERDRAVNEKYEISKKLQDVSIDYERLQKELQV